MRTRFLNVDFCSEASISSFLHLPIPGVSPPNLCDHQAEFLCFDSAPSVVSLDLQRFDTDDVLSRFLSDVLPHEIDVQYPLISSRNRNDFHDEEVLDNEKCRSSSCGGSIENRRGENGSFCVEEGLDEDKRTIPGSELQKIKVTHKEVEFLSEDYKVDTQRALGSGTSELQIEKESTGIEEDEKGFRVFQFEMPETLSFLEAQSYLCEEKDGEIFSEVPEIQTPLDINNDNVAEVIPCPCTVSESVYSVNDIALEYHMEKKISDTVEDTTSVPDRSCLHTIKYLHLEVNEVGLEFYKCSVTEDELHLLLEDIGIQKRAQNHNLVVDGKELLGSTDIDILECLLEHDPSKQCLDKEPQSLNSILEMEFISVNSNFKGNSSDYPEVPDGGLFEFSSPVHFQEVQILELDSSEPFAVTLGSQTFQDPEACDQIFRENSCSMSNLYESFVSHELVPVNDSFISLPIPLQLTDIDIWSSSTIFEDILADLKPHPPSASDVIYLDWHLLQEGRCIHDICRTCRNSFEEIDTYDSDTELKCAIDAVIVNNIVFCNDIPDRSNMLERKEMLNELTGVATSDNLSLDDSRNPEIRKSTLQMKAGTTSDVFKTMSQFNDLNFFLNPGKATMRRNVEADEKTITNVETKIPLVSSSNTSGACDSSKLKLLEWQIEVQEIRLSDNILSLIDNLQTCYLAILGEDKDLKKWLFSYCTVDDFQLLSLPKQKLMDCIKELGRRQTAFSHKDETFGALVALYAIKQMASYLCFYGINTTYFYIDYISKCFNWLGHKLGFLQSMIEDARQKIENDISKSHPSLSTIKEILESGFSQRGSKVLIVADHVFWWPLKKLLTAMGLSFVGLEDSHAHYSSKKEAWNRVKQINCMLDSLLNTSCLLISHLQVSASFPFDKFSCILEYGGSRGVSTISTISPSLAGFPCLHFLKVELEDFHVPKALCEGGVVYNDPELIWEGISESTYTLHKDSQLHKFEDSLNFAPVGEDYICVESLEPKDDAECCSMPITVPNTQCFGGSELKSTQPSCPNIVVIVNTGDVFKEMLISRRSSYQKILAIEKGRAQVVEREINLPVDLIISAELCILWYNCKNIWKKESVGPDANGCIPLCVENIATNVLTSLSFAFISCILIFEGERNFLGAIMESSDELYAAAASLGLDLQLFFSYSSDLTDKIILSSIDYASKLNGSLYPKMSESETLAESFLTSFPSINSLSAHAILSSGSTLVGFIEWSHVNRIQAVRRYHVPDESVALFGALCRYGEQEEAKSGMTECSSVSSAPDSGNSSPKVESQRKKQKQTISIELPLEEDFLCRPLNQSTDCNPKPSRFSKPNISQIFPGSQDISNEGIRSDLQLNDNLFCQPKGLDFSVNNLDWSSTDKKRNVSKLQGEVIDLGEGFLCEDFSIEKNRSFSMREPEIGSDFKLTNSLSARRSLFGPNDHPAFLTPREIKSDSDTWESININVNQDMFPLETLGKSLEEKTVGMYPRKANRLVSPQKASCLNSVTPLSKAIHSSWLPQGSPWTTEFLNKIKEKRKMHQKSVLCNTSACRLGYHDNTESIVKRKSPSTLNSYRYQGGNNSKKMIKQKNEAQSAKPVISSKNVKPSTSLLPSWTPVDKKAKRTLTFARNGNETQSKLIWSGRNFGGPSDAVRKHDKAPFCLSGSSYTNILGSIQML